jgi:hypothetical protein
MSLSVTKIVWSDVPAMNLYMNRQPSLISKNRYKKQVQTLSLPDDLVLAEQVFYSLFPNP